MAKLKLRLCCKIDTKYLSQFLLLVNYVIFILKFTFRLIPAKLEARGWLRPCPNMPEHVESLFPHDTTVGNDQEARKNVFSKKISTMKADSSNSQYQKQHYLYCFSLSVNPL